MEPLRHWMMHYRLPLSLVLLALTLAFIVLAAVAPEVATPIGCGLIALVLLFSVCVRVWENDPATRRRFLP